MKICREWLSTFSQRIFLHYKVFHQKKWVLTSWQLIIVIRNVFDDRLNYSLIFFGHFYRGSIQSKKPLISSGEIGTFSILKFTIPHYDIWSWRWRFCEFLRLLITTKKTFNFLCNEKKNTTDDFSIFTIKPIRIQRLLFIEKIIQLYWLLIRLMDVPLKRHCKNILLCQFKSNFLIIIIQTA